MLSKYKEYCNVIPVFLISQLHLLFFKYFVKLPLFHLGGNMASNLASADMRSNEEDIAIITAQQVTHETHL